MKLYRIIVLALLGVTLQASLASAQLATDKVYISGLGAGAISKILFTSVSPDNIPTLLTITGQTGMAGAASADGSAGGRVAVIGGTGGAAGTSNQNGGDGGPIMLAGGVGGSLTGSGKTGQYGNVSLGYGGGFASVDGGFKLHRTLLNNVSGTTTTYYVDSTAAASEGRRAIATYIDIDAHLGAGDGPVVINLPTADSAGRELLFTALNQNATPNGITIYPAGTDVIAGNGSLSLSSQYSLAKLISNGAGNWYLEESRGAATTPIASNVAFTINDGHLQTSGAAITIPDANLTSSDGTVFDITNSTTSPDFSSLGTQGSGASITLGDVSSDIASNDPNNTPTIVYITASTTPSVITAPGSGYAPGRPVVISGGTGTGATAKITKVDGSGGITEIAVDISGSAHNYNGTEVATATTGNDGLGPNSTDVAGSFTFTTGDGTNGTNPPAGGEFVKIQFKLPYNHAIIAYSPGNASAAGSWGGTHIETDYQNYFKLVAANALSTGATYIYNYIVIEAN